MTLDDYYKFELLTNPSHGWIKVSNSLLRHFNFKVTSYSPVRKTFTYLDEDCDMTRFLAVLKEHGVEYEVNEHFSETFDPWA